MDAMQEAAFLKEPKIIVWTGAEYREITLAEFEAKTWVVK